MAKRDKKKMIRVAVTGVSFSEAAQRILGALPDHLILKKRDGELMIGEGKVLRGLGLNMAAMNLAMFGSADPDTEILRDATKEMFEAAMPKLNGCSHLMGCHIGIPMIFGTGSASNDAEYYKRLWDDSEKPGNVFVPMFGIDSYEFDKEAKGSWYENEENIVKDKMMGYVEQHQEMMRHYREPTEEDVAEHLKKLTDKLSKR